MRLAVIGSRNFPNLDLVEAKLNRILMETADMGEPLVIASGGALGVDRLAEAWGHKKGLEVWSFRPTRVVWGYRTLVVEPNGSQGWNLPIPLPRDNLVHQAPHPRQAFAACAYYRNSLIVKVADKVLAFWDGQSKGTFDGIHKALGVKALGLSAGETKRPRNLEVVLP